MIEVRLLTSQQILAHENAKRTIDQIMSNASIRDIPRIKEMLDQARSMQTLKIISPVLLPLLRLMGVDVSQTEEALKSFEELKQTVEEMAGIPDRFNDLFGERGWIMYDQMNLDVAKAAIAKAEAGDTDGAEADLVNHYDVETVQWQLLTMMGIEAFRPNVSGRKGIDRLPGTTLSRLCSDRAGSSRWSSE